MFGRSVSKPRALTIRAHHPSFGARVDGIEGLRAIAALSILVYHVWLAADPTDEPAGLGVVSRWLLPQLAVGVTLFFTLSGFLLYRRFAAAILREEPLPGSRAYLENRALRILPAYWVALAVCGWALAGVHVNAGNGLHIGSFREGPLTFPLSALFLQNFSPRFVATGIGPAWSLMVEVCFYLALPLLVMVAASLARRAGSRRRRCLAALAPAAIALLVGMSGKLVAFAMVTNHARLSGWESNWQSVVERSIWAQADLFTFGLVVAVLFVQIEDGALAMPRRWRSATFGMAAVIAIVTAVSLPNEISQRGEAGHFAYETLMAVACGLFLAGVVLPGASGRAPARSAVIRLLETKPFVGLGLVSYSLFLWHEPLIYWFRSHELTHAGRRGFAVNLAVLATVSIAVAAVSYFVVERPALARRRKSYAAGRR